MSDQITPIYIWEIILCHLLVSIENIFVFMVSKIFTHFPGPPWLPFVLEALEGPFVFCVWKTFLSITLSNLHCYIPWGLCTARSVIIVNRRELFSFSLSANIPKASTMEKRSNLCQNMVAFFRLNTLKTHTTKIGGGNSVIFSNDCLSWITSAFV